MEKANKTTTMQILGILFTTCFLLNVHAQDIHFSQFNTAPLVLNPALTGQFDGDLRVSSNFKNQWMQVSPNSYNTFAASLDAPFGKKNIYGGLHFFNDRTGDSRMGTNAAYLSFATKIKVNNQNDFSVGLQSGWAQRSMDASKLTWDAQYDGKIFNNNLPSGENISPINFSYFDVATGIYWKSVIKQNYKVNAGLAAAHLNRPKQSFYQNAEKLYVKWTIHADAELKFAESDKMRYKPSLMILKQGPSTETTLGMIVQHGMGKKSKPSHIDFGAFARIRDAFIFYIGYEYQNVYAIGLSYDINISTLQLASNRRGGLEISVIYKFKSKF